MKINTMAQPPAGFAGQPPKAEGKASGDTGFGDILKKSINAVNSHRQEAEALQEGLVNGEHARIHETMIAMEKAGISTRLMIRVQNKVLEAYQEVMRMQL